MILSIFFIGSCQKEENISGEISKISSENYSRRNIDFNEFQNNFFDSNLNRGLTDPFSPTANKGGNNYITHVNTERIVEFSNDDITTFTFNVVTADADHESFTNLIYFEKNDQVGEVILKYSPNSIWLNALLEGDKLAFSGNLSLMSSNGELIQSNEIIDGVPQGRASTTPCIFGATPIWVDCYGADCPCKDGNGFLGGWDFYISCGPAGGGGGGDPGDTGDTGGPGGNSGDGGVGDSGSGQQEGSDGNLPTDPLEWAVFNALNKLRGPNDYFYFDDSINEHNSTNLFQTIGDFESYMNEKITDVYTIVTPTIDGNHNTKVTAELGWFVDLEILMIQTLKNSQNNQSYALHNLFTEYTGLTFGTSWVHTTHDWGVEDDVVIINVYGIMEYNLFLKGIGTVFVDFMHFEIKLDANNGAQISLVEN